MKFKRLICTCLLACLLALTATAQAAQLERAWMEYEDYSGNRVEPSVEDENRLPEVAKILKRAKGNPAKLDGCTVNCTLSLQVKDGDIIDFACATDGCPYIQNRETDKVYSLGGDFSRFWEIFSEVRDGMGFEASAVFDW